MKLSKVSLCAAIALGAMSIASAAAAEVSFNAGAATNYVFRGIRNTYDNHGGAGAPEIFGGVDFSGGPNLYAGAWISNTGYDDENGIEVDYYAGWKPKAGPVNFDLGLIYYTYNSTPSGAVDSDFNTLEIKGAASIAAGPATLGAAVYYSSDWAGTGDSSWYYELNGSIPVKKDIVLSGAIGGFQADAFVGTDSYTTWNLGVTIPVTEKVSFDARYIGTDKDATSMFGALAADDMFVATLKANF